jgi:hypothetical protein
MATIFEYWNGGRLIHNGYHAGYLYEFPPVNHEVVTFFTLTGRIWEVIVGQDCFLQMAGHALDVPNLPIHEVNAFILEVERNMGYVPRLIQSPAMGLNGQLVPSSGVVWVNLSTGRCDAFNYMQGYIQGHQLLAPSQQFSPNFYQQFNTNIQNNGQVQGNGTVNTMKKIADGLTHGNTILKEGSKMYDFFDQQFDWFGGNESNNYDNGGTWQ